MGLRLVRTSSVQPNITNKDDAKMIRYAYGGQDGYIQGYKEEIPITLQSSSSSMKYIKIGSGRLVLQGWEIDIDDNGWILNFSPASFTDYYIYVELNLVDESVNIKVANSFTAGDDLTENPFGKARLLLAHGGLSSSYVPQKDVFPIAYGVTRIENGEIVARYGKTLKNPEVHIDDDVFNQSYAQIAITHKGIYVVEIKYSITSTGENSSLSTVIVISDLDKSVKAMMPAQRGTVEYYPSYKRIEVTSYGNDQKISLVNIYLIAEI